MNFDYIFIEVCSQWWKQQHSIIWTNDGLTDYRCIYASLGISELNVVIFQYQFFYKMEIMQ